MQKIGNEIVSMTIEKDGPVSFIRRVAVIGPSKNEGAKALTGI